MSRYAGLRRRTAKKIDKQMRALHWTQRLLEGGVIGIEEAAMRINRIRAGGVK